MKFETDCDCPACTLTAQISRLKYEDGMESEEVLAFVAEALQKVLTDIEIVTVPMDEEEQHNGTLH